MNDLFKNFTQLLEDYKNRIKFYFKNAPFGDKSFWRLLGLPFIDLISSSFLYGKYVQTSNRETDATGEDLDSVAVRHGILRKQATKSSVFLRFTAPNGTNILAGNKVQTDQSIDPSVITFSVKENNLTLEYTTSTISFDNATNSIIDSANGFTFIAGDYIYIEDTTNNDGIVQIETATAGNLTISENYIINNEIAGTSFTLARVIEAESRVAGETQNTGANSLVVLTNSITGVSAVTNPEESFGGVDDEADGDVWRGWLNDDELTEGQTNKIDVSNFRGRILEAIFNNFGKITRSGYAQTVENGVATVRNAFAINDYDYQGGFPDVINIFFTVNYGDGIPSVQDIQDVEDLFVWDTATGDANRDPVDTIVVQGINAVDVDATYTVTPDPQYNTVTLKTQLQTLIEERLTDYLFKLDAGDDVLMEALDNVVYQTVGVYNMVRTLPASDVSINVDSKARAGTLSITVS